jgi:hypothetical protein
LWAGGSSGPCWPSSTRRTCATCWSRRTGRTSRAGDPLLAGGAWRAFRPRRPGRAGEGGLGWAHRRIGAHADGRDPSDTPPLLASRKRGADGVGDGGAELPAEGASTGHGLGGMRTGTGLRAGDTGQPDHHEDTRPQLTPSDRLRHSLRVSPFPARARRAVPR